MNNLPPVPPPAKEEAITSKVPINVFNGFLGSGKTTIISNLIQQIKDKEKVVFIKNEDGEADIDSKLVADEKLVAEEMLNGCVCCTLVGPLLDTIDEILDEYKPDRIILESSGTAEPTNLAITLNGNPRIFRDSMVSVIDVLNFDQEPTYNDHYQIQAKMTDLLLLNKIETVDTAKKKQVIDVLRSFNSYSPIIEAVNADISPDVVFGIPSKLQTIEHHPHEHHREITSFTISINQPIDLHQIESVLDTLPESMIRVKGLVHAPEPLIINQAYKRRTLTKPANNVDTSKSFLYFIGLNIEEYKEEITEKINRTT